MKRYVWELTRNAAMLVGGLTGLVMAALAICCTFLAHHGDELLTAMLLVMLCGVIVYAALMVQLIPFVRMIRRQEANGLKDAEVQRLERGLTGTYLGCDWIIHAGHVALHHSRIRDVKRQYCSGGSAGGSSYICVTTVDGRQYRWLMGGKQVRDIQVWLKRHKVRSV